MTRRPTTACLDDISGLDAFAGDLIDTSAWDPSYPFKGKRVAVIGTDLRVVELLPDIVAVASSVKVFQRSPAWVVPRLPVVARVAAASPITRRALALVNLRLAVADPWVRRQLTPSQTGRRGPAIVTSTYYPALQAENCRLITWPVYALTERGVRTAEGIEHLADCIVLATGGDVLAPSRRLRPAHPERIAKETA